MDKLLIRGGKALKGEMIVSGAKNAALPELCAALLTADAVTLRNVPKLQDIATMAKLIRHMGVDIQQPAEGVMQLNASALNQPEAPYDLVKTMRASVLVLGPLLARFGRARVSLPGGCAIGSRPVDQHIKGLQAMGAIIDVEHGYMMARLKPGQSRLKGARIATDMVTVTGTENLLMAACLADGETVLENAAQEPEILDLVMGDIHHGGAQLFVQSGDLQTGLHPQGSFHLFKRVFILTNDFKQVFSADKSQLLGQLFKFKCSSTLTLQQLFNKLSPSGNGFLRLLKIEPSADFGFRSLTADELQIWIQPIP